VFAHEEARENDELQESSHQGWIGRMNSLITYFDSIPIAMIFSLFAFSPSVYASKSQQCAAWQALSR
jgi:hypothetical protein